MCVSVCDREIDRERERERCVLHAYCIVRCISTVNVNAGISVFICRLSVFAQKPHNASVLVCLTAQNVLNASDLVFSDCSAELN